MTIFPDLDGVITTSASWAASEDLLSENAVACLNKLLGCQSSEIVITSTWRAAHTLEELRSILSCLAAPIIDVTPILTCRGAEILSWLTNKNIGKQYLVIDDFVDEIVPYIADEHIVHVKDGFNKDGFAAPHLAAALERIEKLRN